jgi:hypothetical protein
MKHVIIYFLISFSINVFAQTSTNFSHEVIGDWKGNGTLFNYPASFKMEWNLVLDNKFLKLEFENRFSDPSGNERIMNAHAYYDLKNEKGHWFDSRGMILPFKFELKDKMMTVFWGDERSERGKTVYSFIGNNGIHVIDYVFTNGNYQPFGDAKYEKLL